MGKIKHKPQIEEFIKKTPVFWARDIEKIVKNKNYAHLLLHKLNNKGVVFRLTKGCYTAFPDPILSVLCFKPAYLGLQEALSLYNLWDQETIPVVLNVHKVRQGIRKILDNNIYLRYLPSKYFFGFELIRYGDFYLPVSDSEKTLIDFVWFKEHLSESALKQLKQKIKKEKLKKYLKKYPEEFQKKVKQMIKIF